MKLEERKKKFEQVDIYPVTCEALSNGRSNFEILQAIINGGAKVVQLREKELPDDKFLEIAKEFRKITSKHGILLIINDRINIALEVDADGVHLGQNDMPVAEARKIAPELLIGASARNVEDAVKAEKDGADYIAIGPIFPTRTKSDATPIGFGEIKPIVSKINIPAVGIGGIDLNNIDQIVSQGIRKIAVITAITQAEDPSEATKQLIIKIQN